MRQLRKTGICALVIACLVTMISAQKKPGGGKPVSDPYSNSSAFVLLTALSDTDISGLDAMEPTTPPMLGLFYNSTRDCLTVLGDDDGRRDIPTARVGGSTGYVHNAVLVIDDDGNLSTTTGNAGGTVNPIIQLFITPMPVTWPTDLTGVGRNWPMQIDSITREVNPGAFGGYSYRPYLIFKPTFYLQRQANLDLTSGVKQAIYTAPNDAAGDTQAPITGVDALYVKLNTPSGDLSGVVVNFGWNSTADDVIKEEDITDLDGATKVIRLLPMRGFVRGAPGDTFGMRVTATAGAAATVTATLYGEVVYGEN